MKLFGLHVRGRWEYNTSIEHRVLAETMLGRPLKPLEVVHYKNGDHTDHRPENLQVLNNQREHASLEQYQKREAQGITHLFDLPTWLTLLEPPQTNAPSNEQKPQTAAQPIPATDNTNPTTDRRSPLEP